MRIVFLLACCTLSAMSFAQSDSIAYSREFEFREGFFLCEQNFLRNEPVQKKNILSDIPNTATDFMTEVMSHKVVRYKDSSGNEKSVQSSQVWGYCQNRNLFLNMNGEFNRVNVIGTLCHLLAPVLVNQGFHDPMNANYALNTSYEEMRQFVYDTRQDKLYEFNPDNMEVILRSDPELHEEFIKLKKRKRSDSIFIYLRKFNERHPLMLPAK